MQTILLMVGSFLLYIIAYHTYGRFLAKKIFKLNPNSPVPSRELNDGVDYVPSPKGIIFGHHFTSIAGTGPIVGPAIGVIWGWLPALTWVLLGSIFMGAVHDFGTLVISLRNEGKSISEIAARYINSRVRFIFFVIVFLTLLIVIAIFGVVIAAVFSMYPGSVIPVWTQIPIAMLLGWAIYKKGVNITIATIAAVIFMYAFVIIGAVVNSKWPGACSLPVIGSMPATGSWTIILLIYAFVASTLPVTTLLQPRDYINAWQLFTMMGMLVAGVFISGFAGKLEIIAPAINTASTGAPPMWPFMFVTIACGAISGFHSLVASGTSPKQVSHENDSLFIGYGSMLLEGALAVLILICVIAGVAMYSDDSHSIWLKYYSSWMGEDKGLSAKLAPVVGGASNLMTSVGIPAHIGIVLMGVFIASFAGTTLDTAVRLQRYITSELASDLKIKPLTNKWLATTFAVATAAGVAFATGADGKGAMTLWPLFGAVNQLLAGLALLVVTMYLKQKGGLKYIVAALPCVFMLIITVWSLLINFSEYYQTNNWLLLSIGSAILFLSLWMFVETVILFMISRKQLIPSQVAKPEEAAIR